MAAVGTALLIASLAFVSLETLAYRSLQRRELGNLADLVEANSAAALTFEDSTQGEAALEPLKRQGDVKAASLFTDGGSLIAGFEQQPGGFHIDPPAFRDRDRMWFAQGRLQMIRSIVLQGRRVGTLCLIADLSGLRQQLLWGAGAVLGIAALSFLLAFGVSQKLQRGLAEPLAQLAGAARTVAKRHDYGFRLQPGGQDELGLLMEDFNEMLTQIEQRDHELHSHRERLEELVRARTSQLEQDIAQRKSLEKQLLRAQRMESLGTLAGGVAHDLNNVLAPIMLSIQVLQERAGDPRDQKVLAIIESSTQRGSEIVKQILGFARGVEGERKPIHFPALVQELASIIRQTFPKGISLRTGLAPKLLPVIGDATQIHQLLLNLCVNARDAMFQTGQLTLEVHNESLGEAQARLRLDARPGAYVVLTVTDTGCGMGPQTLDRMFEPFYTTKETGKGTGLGLSMVHTIARSHGGFIRCKSVIGQGTTFQVFLPAAGRGGDLEAGREPQAPAILFPDGGLVLVVDDEAAILELTRQTLEGFGLRTLTAADGGEAVALYRGRAGEITLVLTDMMMPVLDGPGTIQALRAINPAVRIIATSGLHGYSLAVPARTPESGGADLFLPKPFNAEALKQAVQRVLAMDRGFQERIADMPES